MKLEKIEVEDVQDTFCDNITYEPKYNPPFNCSERVFEDNVKKKEVLSPLTLVG